MTRRVGVFTSSRADLGPLGPVIRALDEHPEVELVVIATGTHLAEHLGGRLEDIKVSTDSRIEVIDVGVDRTTPVELGDVYGRVGTGVSRVLTSAELDILLLLGDRWELLAAAGAALIHGVPIAHLHGGETTEGAIDDRIRHGITKLADLHLCATTDSARRIRHMGEESWRIIVTGAPGLDRMSDVEALSDAELEELLGRPLVRPFGLVVYHPPTVDRTRVREEAHTIYSEAASHLGTGLALYPGADPGADVIIEELEEATAAHSNVITQKNLGDRYLRVLKAADVLIGNSSSGIIEAASLGVPVIDVGDRQDGRLRPANVIHVDKPSEIADSLREALGVEFRERIASLENPYGDGRSSVRILRALLKAPLGDLARKPWFDLATSNEVPVESMTIGPEATVRDAMAAIDRGAQQIALVVTEDQTLVGTLTDGDIRRAILAGASLEQSALDYATRVPAVASPHDSPVDVLAEMRRELLTRIPIVDEDGKLTGLHAMTDVVANLLVAPHDTSAHDAPDPGT